jgi:outer membrane protein
MRKFVFIICTCIPLCSFSQIEKPVTKGNFIISGGGSIEYSKYKSDNVEFSKRDYSFNPGLGYFILDNFAIGLNTTFGYSKLSVKSYTYGLGPYAKYYFKNGIFLKTETFYSYNIQKATEITPKTHSLTVAPGIGYSFFLNSKISLEPSLNYSYVHTKLDEAIFKNNNVFFELKLNLFL